MRVGCDEHINIPFVQRGKSVEKREQRGTPQPEVLPSGGIIATDGKLNEGIVMDIQ